MRVGHGFDAHRLVEGRRLVLAGIEIPHDRGALGHSDADVLAHAVADAILGAAALGDLGSRFPDSDPRWKDADSMELLGSCAADVHRAGLQVLNVDATIVVDAPRLAPFLETMRENVAARLLLAADCVGIKAKRSEGLGYTGDGTGIACYAVALLTNV
jgi:2-C-methyl-D-erythritol 2,4-cyclodiphosphate synthase